MDGNRPVVASLRGMVAAAHPQAAFVGARILREGGNAFDAAVATAAALGVVEPFMSGPAGLGMASYYSQAEGKTGCLDFVPGVPRGFDASACTKEDTYLGPKASGVPGNLAGWHAMSTRYGRLPWATLLAPAIELASEGVPVTQMLPTVTPEYWALRSSDPEWVRVYANGGEPMPVGWVLRQTDLANTLSRIAVEGPSVFYEGAIAQQMVHHLSSLGGWLSAEDLAAVEPHWLSTVSVAYRGRQIHSLPPPAEAFQCLATLGILDAVDVAGLKPDDVDHVDTIIRAARLAAEARITHNQASRQHIEALLSGELLEHLRERFHAGDGIHGRAQQWQPMTDPERVGRREHTTSLSVGDSEGNLVCMTQSLGSIYGSGVVIPGTGICMNNFLNWGDLNPASPNHLRPGGRLSMCLAPTVTMQDDKPILALGTPGSYGILHTQVQALVQHFDFGLPLQQAIEAPRVRLWDDNLVHAEGRFDASTIARLNERGHVVHSIAPWTRVVGGIQAVSRDPVTRALIGAADPRRDGYAASP
jgi:gamma-glutamyltranspeptidase / glutathione hydrolase